MTGLEMLERCIMAGTIPLADVARISALVREGHSLESAVAEVSARP